MNPNYRYRPTYRKEVPSKRRRKKAVDEEEIEEEDRQCEVVARVLLEGREVDTDELEREVEEQKIKDQLEGRQRTSRSRSRSRSNSKLSDGFNNNNNSNNLHTDAQGFFLGMGGRPSSAPPQGADPFEGNANVPAIDHHFNGMSSRGKRSRTIGTSGPDFMQGQYSSLPQHQHPNVHPQVSHQRYMSESVGHNAPPSLRNASNLQHLFNNNEPSSASSEPAHSGNGYSQFPPVSQSPFLSSFSGFKGGNGDVSLLSPSFSRKFSLGRWEVPHHHHATGANFGSGHPFTGQQGSENPVVAASTLHQHSAPANGTVSSATSSLGSQEQTNYSTVAQPTSDQAFDPAAVPPGYNFVPTYVYLSKEDAQNPQVCLIRLANDLHFQVQR